MYIFHVIQVITFFDLGMSFYRSETTSVGGIVVGFWSYLSYSSQLELVLLPAGQQASGWWSCMWPYTASFLGFIFYSISLRLEWTIA